MMLALVLALVSVACGALAATQAGTIEHPVLRQYVLVVSVVWVVAGLLQLGLWAIARVARVGRLAFFFVAVLLGGGGAMTALLVPGVTDASQVLTVVGVVWLVAFLLYLGEFVGLGSAGRTRRADRTLTR